MTSPKRLQIVLMLILGIALAASLAAIVHQSRRIADFQRQRATDLKTLHQLQEVFRQQEIKKAPVESSDQIIEEHLRSALAQRDTAISKLRRQLQDARDSVVDLQAQLLYSNDENKKALASANDLLQKQKQQQEFQNQINALKQQVDYAEAELQASRHRVTAVEADNAKLRNNNSAGSARAAAVKRAVAQLQDLSRSRDAYLASIMQHYRDITSQFQAMSGMLGASRNSNSNAFSGEALSRIQDAMSQAGDDLRRLDELNGQVRRLEAKLAKK